MKTQAKIISSPLDSSAGHACLENDHNMQIDKYQNLSAGPLV